ncbi:MAG: methyltransferase domain-containing protein, partial [Pseudomonadota bacterium]
ARCYRHRLGTALPEADDSFAGAVCTGAFGPGHAPPETLEELARVTRPGGVVVFNTLSRSMVEQGFPEVMDRLVNAGRWRLLFESADFRPFILTEPELLARLFAFGID